MYHAWCPKQIARNQLICKDKIKLFPTKLAPMNNLKILCSVCFKNRVLKKWGSSVQISEFLNINIWHIINHFKSLKQSKILAKTAAKNVLTVFRFKMAATFSTKFWNLRNAQYLLNHKSSLFWFKSLTRIKIRVTLNATWPYLKQNTKIIFFENTWFPKITKFKR